MGPSAAASRECTRLSSASAGEEKPSRPPGRTLFPQDALPARQLPLAPGRAELELEIHEGFDFGFKGQAFQAADYLDGARPPMRSAWSYSTAPSPGSSVSSAAGDEAGPEWGDDSVTPRPHAPAEEGDYFMKRGAWKRRGIVFTSGITLAGEDESFDLEL